MTRECCARKGEMGEGKSFIQQFWSKANLYTLHDKTSLSSLMIFKYHIGVLGQQHLGLELDAGLSEEESTGLRAENPVQSCLRTPIRKFNLFI